MQYLKQLSFGRVVSLVMGGLLLAPYAAASELDVKVFKNCPAETSEAASLVLQNSRVNLLQGWSHAESVAPEQFKMQKTKADYLIDASRWQSQSDCRDDKTYQTLLVKKVGDWSQNHINGIEPMLDRAGMAFSSISAIKLTLRIDSRKTALPTSEQIQQTFSFASDAAALEALDQGNVTLGLTLFGEHFSDQGVKTPNANFLLTIKPEQFNDWLTITLPVTNMNFYWEQNYSPTAASQSELANEKIMGFRITPETDSGRVARSLNPNAWETARKELFKEMAVEFREIVLLTQ